MICDWQAFIKLLPSWMRDYVDKQGSQTLQELRLRLNSPPELVLANSVRYLNKATTSDDLQQCVNAASAYSPWTTSTIAEGFITAPGGHRIGIFGEGTIHDRQLKNIRKITSLCIRVARDFPGIATSTAHINSSVLIIGRPGCGKTTLLRDMIRIHADKGKTISVIDERQELFPVSSAGFAFSTGRRTDILSGCSKAQGIEMALRCMSPEIIAVDEISSATDCNAIVKAGWCGVDLFATAHAGNFNDFLSREVYRPLIETNLFHTVIVMRPDKCWAFERVCK